MSQARVHSRRGSMVAPPIQRRIFHICAGSLFPILLFFFPGGPVLVAASVLLALSLMLEGLRFRYAGFNRLFLKWMRLLVKDKEKRTVLGSTYVLTGTVVVIASVSEPVAVLALFFLSIGDPLAALVGQRLGSHRLKDKSLEGSAAFFAGSVAVGAAVLAGGLESTIPVMLVGAAAATLLEAFPLWLDDNLTVPVGAAGAMALTGLVWA